MNYFRLTKTLWFLLTLCCLLFSLSCKQTSNETNELESQHPDTRKLRLLSALNQLSKIHMPSDAKDEKLIAQKQEEIYKIVTQFDNPEDISALAMLSRSMSHHCRYVECSKQSQLEPTYDNAFWASIKILAKDVKKNRDVLDRLKYMAVLDGTDDGDWGRIVERKEFP